MLPRYFFIPIFVLICAFDTHGQNYGLEFIAREKNSDHRTELNLNPTKSFKFKNDFELSFDLLLRKKIIQTSYFGYILRVIGDDQYNIDLMHNKFFVDSVDLNMVFGQDTSRISYDFENDFHFDHWINVRLRFHISTQELEFILPDTSFIHSNVPIDYNQSVKFIFGACDFGRFKTRDIPPFNLRDVKISVNEKLKYHWPLMEIEGTQAVDIVRNKIALVRNPNWIKKMHLDWVKSFEVSINGIGLVAANPNEEKVYLVGEEEMIIYSVMDDSFEKIQYDNKISLSIQEQAIYFPGTNSIYCYYIDKQKISAFDLGKRQWQIKESNDQKLRGFRHHNKFLSDIDSTLYLFGGYGYHEYKNIVQRVNLVTNEWNIMEGNWDAIYKPRYLGTLGGKQDTIYMLGGYGSSSGDQMISPQNFPELLAYSIKDNRFVRKFDIEYPKDDFVFGNSMIIDSETDNYYALAFSRFKVDNSLQLIRGNLAVPTIEIMADEIPYTHYDTKSFVDLFYFQESDYLITYTGILDESGNTGIELHKLKFPPNYAPIQLANNNFLNKENIVFLLSILVVISLVSLIYYKFKNKKVHLTEKDVSSPSDEIEEWKIILDELGLSETKNKGVHCFGGFRVFDTEGRDITGEFTPLLKELYLLILLHTLKDDKGISSEKLLEILWFDKGLESARNNRAVNIAKLRTILDKVGNCEITHNTGYWKIISKEPEIYNDYFEYIKITQRTKNPTKRDILKLIIIAGKGPILGNVTYEWLDAFKSTISDSIINTLIQFSENLNIKNDAHLVIQIADCIFNFDSINEDAMILKCKAHHELGSHSLPKNTYSNFVREYNTLYGEEYAVSFADIIKKSRSEIIDS